MDILVCGNTLEIGGAERSLIGLLTALKKNNHNVDLFLCRHTGALMSHIPENINLLPEDRNASSIDIAPIAALKKGAVGVVVARAFAKVAATHYVKKKRYNPNNIFAEYIHYATHRFVRQIGSKKQYDVVIAFHEPHYIAAYRVKAKRKIAWMHTDYKAIGVDRKHSLKVWQRFDKIVAISEDCLQHFKEVFPELGSKLVLCENPLPKDLIFEQAEAGVTGEMLGGPWKNLLSIGRYCLPKNFDNVPDICRRIVKAGMDVRWYIIGFGVDEQVIKERIKEACMEKHVILLGKKENPYPYIKMCDLYVQPSRYEGKCVAVREAQLLGKPVVITDYPTSASQLENGVDGIIVPLQNEKCAQEIESLLRNPLKMREIAEVCSMRDYSNLQGVEKIIQSLK